MDNIRYNKIYREIVVMFCNECGENNRNDRKFCTNCGAPLRDYTKPRENLIMPEEIENKQIQVLKYGSIIKNLNISMFIFLGLAIGCTLASLFLRDIIQLVLIIGCWVSLLVYFVLMIIKNKLTKKKNNTNSK